MLRIYESIKPHFYGEVPPALDKAFPNEDEQILQYRKNTYQPKTESPVVKAITELHRLLSSAKHSVRFENTDMKEFAENEKFGDSNLQSYIFSVFIPNRVLDPNAVLLIEPKGEGLETDNVRVNIDMKVIQSDRIVFNDPEYRLLIYKGISKNKYANLGIENPLYYHIVTDTKPSTPSSSAPRSAPPRCSTRSACGCRWPRCTATRSPRRCASSRVTPTSAPAHP